jgi:hypothetical protein
VGILDHAKYIPAPTPSSSTTTPGGSEVFKTNPWRLVRKRPPNTPR